MLNDQLISKDVDAITTYGAAGSEVVLENIMRHFLVHNPSGTRGVFISWSGKEDAVYVPPGKQVAINDRSTTERFWIRADGVAGGAMVVHVSCSGVNRMAGF